MSLFQVEFGRYFKSASPENPVGVCTKCLLLRTRDEVDPAECCPADLVEAGLQHLDKASSHDWKGFKDPSELEAYVKANFEMYKRLLSQVAEIIPSNAGEQGQE